MLIVIGLAVASGQSAPSAAAPHDARPVIRKLGAIDCDMVETTPIVWRGRLYRFEYVRRNYKPNTTGDSYFRFIDVATGRPTPAFAAARDCPLTAPRRRFTTARWPISCAQTSPGE